MYSDFCKLLSTTRDLVIDNLEKDIVSSFPISVYNGDFEINDIDKDENKYFGRDIIRKDMDNYVHKNRIDSRYTSRYSKYRKNTYTVQRSADRYNIGAYPYRDCACSEGARMYNAYARKKLKA